MDRILTTLNYWSWYIQYGSQEAEDISYEAIYYGYRHIDTAAVYKRGWCWKG